MKGWRRGQNNWPVIMLYTSVEFSVVQEDLLLFYWSSKEEKDYLWNKYSSLSLRNRTPTKKGRNEWIGVRAIKITILNFLWYHNSTLSLLWSSLLLYFLFRSSFLSLSILLYLDFFQLLLSLFRSKAAGHEARDLMTGEKVGKMSDVEKSDRASQGWEREDEKERKQRWEIRV